MNNLERSISILSICLIMIVVGFALGLTYNVIKEVEKGKPPMRIIEGKYTIVRDMEKDNVSDNTTSS